MVGASEIQAYLIIKELFSMCKKCPVPTIKVEPRVGVVAHQAKILPPSPMTSGTHMTEVDNPFCKTSFGLHICTMRPTPTQTNEKKNM